MTDTSNRSDGANRVSTGGNDTTNDNSSGSDSSAGAVDQLVAKAAEMKDRVSGVQDEIAAIETQGEAAGGLVSATCDGNGSLKAIRIDPSLMQGEAAVLEELVVNAVAHARGKAREEAGQKVGDALGGLPIPSAITSVIAQFLPSRH